MAKDRAFKVFLALPYDVIDNLAEMVDAFQTDDEITKAVSRYVMLGAGPSRKSRFFSRSISQK